MIFELILRLFSEAPNERRTSRFLVIVISTNWSSILNETSIYVLRYSRRHFTILSRRIVEVVGIIEAASFNGALVSLLSPCLSCCSQVLFQACLNGSRENRRQAVVGDEVSED